MANIILFAARQYNEPVVSDNPQVGVDVIAQGPGQLDCLIFVNGQLQTWDFSYRLPCLAYIAWVFRDAGTPHFKAGDKVRMDLLTTTGTVQKTGTMHAGEEAGYFKMVL